MGAGSSAMMNGRAVVGYLVYRRRTRVLASSSLLAVKGSHLHSTYRGSAVKAPGGAVGQDHELQLVWESREWKCRHLQSLPTVSCSLSSASWHADLGETVVR